jgi:hypothetical protein
VPFVRWHSDELIDPTISPASVSIARKRLSPLAGAAIRFSSHFRVPSGDRGKGIYQFRRADSESAPSLS